MLPVAVDRGQTTVWKSNRSQFLYMFIGVVFGVPVLAGAAATAWLSFDYSLHRIGLEALLMILLFLALAGMFALLWFYLIAPRRVVDEIEISDCVSLRVRSLGRSVVRKVSAELIEQAELDHRAANGSPITLVWLRIRGESGRYRFEAASSKEASRLISSLTGPTHKIDGTDRP